MPLFFAVGAVLALVALWFGFLAFASWQGATTEAGDPSGGMTAVFMMAAHLWNLQAAMCAATASGVFLVGGAILDRMDKRLTPPPAE